MHSGHDKPLQTAHQQAVFHKDGESLYRLESSGGYYALIKRGGKQFRRSLKTKDRKLAERRLADLRAKVGALTISEDSNSTFEQTAKQWLETVRHLELKTRSATPSRSFGDAPSYVLPFKLRLLFRIFYVTTIPIQQIGSSEKHKVTQNEDHN